MTDVTPGGGVGRSEQAGRRPDDEIESREEEAALRAGETERRQAAGLRPGEVEQREARAARPGGEEPPGTTGARLEGGERRGAAGARPEGVPREGRLLPRDESDKFSLRLQHAVGGFVDSPQEAVEEADHVVEEVASRLAEAVASRRRTLKASWQETGDSGDTEQLRLALRDYRATAERLLSL